MKVILPSETKANLSRFPRTGHNEPVIVTVNGVLAFHFMNAIPPIGM